MERLSVDPNTGPDTQYDTKYQKSLRHYLTREALPKESNYRDISSIHDKRPTLDELHESTFRGPQESGAGKDVEAQELKGKVIKFGWIQGVLMRCMLNIWGVMLFLRLSWMVGQCGLVEALVVVCAGNLVTTITAISMSAVATNGLIKGGGVYYMISRSLGPEFGGSIGLMFTIANSIAVATYIIGFVESLQDMLTNYFDTMIIDNGKNDIRAVGTITLVLLLGLAIVGMDWVTRVQMGLLVLLIFSQIDVVIGVFMGPLNDKERAMGFVGFNGDLFNANVWSDYRHYEGKDQNIISVFAVFFTAVTGIVAGANLSGDLKDPSSSIPKGTLLAIVITFCSYIIYPFMLAGSVTRDATGIEQDFIDCMNSTDYINGTIDSWQCPGFTNEFCSLAGDGVYNSNDPNITDTCDFGLENSSQVMELMAAWGPLIYLGCFAATLSSAIASLVGAPRILQALAKDKLYPGIESFSRGYGANNDPIRGYLLVCLLTLACIMVASLNAVSTLLSNFFLASYSLINFSCFHASFIKSPGWRPSFKYYNLWMSLIGGILCLIVMFLIDYITALVTFVVTIALYLFVSYRKPDVNWGSSTQAQTYVSALKSTLDLQTVEEHVKNYRPQILILSGQPSARPPLIDLCRVITKDISLMSCGHIVKNIDTKLRVGLVRRNTDWLTRNGIRSFYHLVDAADLETGADCLFQVVGLGKLRPNMILIGMKTNWNTCDRAELKAYFNTLHSALSMQLGVAMLRVGSGLDYSQIIEDDDIYPGKLGPAAEAADNVNEAPNDNKVSKKKKRKSSLSDLYHGPGGTNLSPDIIENITVFKRKQTSGTIDVWWLYDDGGLTLLLPYILTTRSNWTNCKLRIFALANRKDELDVEQRSMANLLAKFRIDYGDVIVIPDSMKKAKDSSKAEFDEMIKDFRTNDSSGDGCTITDGELSSQKEKINRHLRLRELLLENSMESKLIIMTLPMPRKSHVSASLYMAWLDYISKGMPPFLFVRGNQQSVLTFYS